MMRRVASTIFVVAASLSSYYARAAVTVNPSQDQPPKNEPKDKPDSKGVAASLTGCVDEQDGKWVLVSDQTMTKIANLEADGFPPEAFAKYLGHKVNVRGTASSGEVKSTFKVREIKSISDTCTAR